MSANTVLRTRATGYDLAGNPVSSTDGRGFVTTRVFDATNLLTQLIEPVDGTATIVTSFGYDAAGNRTRYTDGNANATVYTFNPWNQLESTIEPATTATPNAADRTYTTAYDAEGRPVGATEPGGITRTRTFDPLDNLRTETGSGAIQSTPDRVMDYDKAGRLTAASSPSSDNTYTYNDRGQLLETDGPAGQASFGYDDAGQLVSRTDPAGQASFGYDLNGRLATATEDLTGATRTYTYDPADQPLTESFGTGNATRTMAYDPLGRITSDTLTDPSTAVTASIAYGYDLDDNLTSKTTTGAAGSATNAYTYDQAGRLTSWNDGSNPAVTYTWDGAGNRTSAGGITATYDQRNRLLSQGSTDYTYTPRGTLATTDDGTTVTTLEFDAFNRLTTHGTTEYEYDALDRVATRNDDPITYVGLENDIATDDTTGKYARDPNGNTLAARDFILDGAVLQDRHDDLVASFDLGFPSNRGGFLKPRWA